MNLWRSSSLHPGWPMPVGPLRVPAGVVRLRPVRLRDASQWSRIRLADRAHLEPWEPATDVDWDSAPYDFVVASRCARVCGRRPARAGCCRM